MNDVQIRQVMRANAVFFALAGLLLLVATWQGLYDLLSLPIAQPEVFSQLGGAVLIGFAYVLSTAPDNTGMLRPVARGAAVANALAALVILVWLVTGKLGIGGLGDVIFVAALLILAALAYFQYRVSQGQAQSWSRDESTRPLA
jgi:hypothetical protein